MNIFKKLFNLIKTSSNNEANLPVTREEYEALKQKISELEQRQLEDRKFKEFLESHIKKKNLEHKIDEYLHELSIDVNPSTRKAAIEGLKIIDVVNSYGFSKYVPDIKKEYNTRVISIDDLRKNPENYLFKLHKGFLNFPLGIDFSYVNSVLFENF